MPRYRRRRSYRRGGVLALVILLVIALVLIALTSTGQEFTVNLPSVDLPPLPNITIPITGLPEVNIPSVQIPLTIEPGTLIPGIGIGGTPAPALGPRTKTSGCQIQGTLPDGACTPGSVLNVSSDQVCQPGYASSVRDVSESERDQVYAAYGIANTAPGQYEIDHLVPLSLGGSNDISNLWPQPDSANLGNQEKDAVENYLHDQVCSGSMSLADAQRSIASNWVTVYSQMP